jgi:hypothetical protein
LQSAKLLLHNNIKSNCYKNFVNEAKHWIDYKNILKTLNVLKVDIDRLRNRIGESGSYESLWLGITHGIFCNEKDFVEGLLNEISCTLSEVKDCSKCGRNWDGSK